MNQVETYSWNALRELILAIDPERKGWCVDAGIGEFDFYFEWFHNFCYDTLAIEPFPCVPVIERCQQYHVPLFKGALSSQDGLQPMYNDGSDLNALYPDHWDSVRDMVAIADVTTISLKSLLRTYGVQRFTALKLDIEGAENAVIATLPMLRSCPSVLCFEFGGLVAKSEARGAWSNLNTYLLESSLQVLKEVGYSHLLYVIGGDGTRLVARENDGSLPFVDSDVWGNILAVRRGKYDLVAMAQSEVRFAP